MIRCLYPLSPSPCRCRTLVSGIPCALPGIWYPSLSRLYWIYTYIKRRVTIFSQLLLVFPFFFIFFTVSRDILKNFFPTLPMVCGFFADFFKKSCWHCIAVMLWLHRQQDTGWHTGPGGISGWIPLAVPFPTYERRRAESPTWHAHQRHALENQCAVCTLKKEWRTVSYLCMQGGAINWYVCTGATVQPFL